MEFLKSTDIDSNKGKKFYSRKNFIFPDIVLNGLLPEVWTKESLIADGLDAYALCLAGMIPPKEFGNGMVLISKEIGVPATLVNLQKLSAKIARQNRVRIVNEIMLEISSRSRRFFHYEGKVAELVDKGRIYYKSERGSVKMVCLSIPDYRTPKGWNHGGTLFCLVKEFREFIKTGVKYDRSGLYSPHWGYPEIDMKAIQEKAKRLGYLNHTA